MSPVECSPRWMWVSCGGSGLLPRLPPLVLSDFPAVALFSECSCSLNYIYCRKSFTFSPKLLISIYQNWIHCAASAFYKRPLDETGPYAHIPIEIMVCFGKALNNFTFTIDSSDEYKNVMNRVAQWSWTHRRASLWLASLLWCIDAPHVWVLSVPKYQHLITPMICISFLCFLTETCCPLFFIQLCGINDVKGAKLSVRVLIMNH